MKSISTILLGVLAGLLVIAFSLALVLAAWVMTDYLQHGLGRSSNSSEANEIRRIDW